jgi:hypothetical protein
VLFGSWTCVYLFKVYDRGALRELGDLSLSLIIGSTNREERSVLLFISTPEERHICQKVIIVVETASCLGIETQRSGLGRYCDLRFFTLFHFNVV